MSINDRLLDHAIGHHIRVQRYSAGQSDNFQPIINDAHAQIRSIVRESSEVVNQQDTSTAAFAALIASILGVLDDMRVALQTKMEESLRQFVRSEADNELAVLKAESGLDLVKPKAADLESVITDVAFQGRYLETWIDDLARGDFSRIQATLIAGMQRGNTASEISGVLDVTAFSATANLLTNLVRTIWNGVTNWVRSLLFGANSDVIVRVQWHATLDEITCPVCGDLDGRVFPVNQIDPPPAHPSCRCFLVAVFGDIARLLRSKRHGKVVKRFGEAKRALFTGKDPKKLRYATWLQSQTLAVQNEALGITRAKLFRKGKLKISRFVSAKGHVLTLAELKRRDASAFRRAGLRTT